MGNCGGKMSEEEKANRAIEEAMRREKRVDESKLKLLLLGAGESGKSTLFKQMKILYSDAHNFSDSDRQRFISVIHKNILADMRELVRVSGDELKDQDFKETFQSWAKDQKLGSSELDVLQSLWSSDAIMNTWANRGKVQVQDSLEYYMDKIEEVCTEDFTPSIQDILRARVRTTGVVTETFRIGEATFEMYDVGGQRNERRKWMHSFENVTSVLFVAAVSEFNQVLFEDNSKNRQEEAIELFGKQLRTECFVNTPFILFLNKTDLLMEKLSQHVPFKVTEGEEARNIDYMGPETEEGVTYKTDGSDEKFEEIFYNVKMYLREKYLDEQNFSETKRQARVYPHFTNSTDSDNIRKIMDACKDIILQINLEKGGWVSAGI